MASGTAVAPPGCSDSLMNIRSPPREGAPLLGRASSNPRLSAREKHRPGQIVAILAMCGTVVSLQQTLVLPLLPDFPRILSTTVDNASWLVTATLLTGAVAIPSVTRLADMFGKKRMMVVCLAVMVLGSILGSFSDVLWLVVTARALQGVGMALIPVGIAIMRDELPRDRLPLGVALMSATLAIGAGAGLPLAGLLTKHFDWHSIFWVTGLAGLLMLLAVARAVPESPVLTRGTFDYRGALLLSVALTSGLLVLSKGGSWGWTSWPTILLAVVGVLVLLAWLPFELRVSNPLVDLRVAARPTVLLVNIASVLTGFAMFSNMLVTTQLLQLPTSSGYGLGMDVLQTGLWTAPTALVFGAMAPVAAWGISRFGPQVTLLAGAAVMSGAYVGRVFLSQDLWQIVGGAMLVAAGTSMTFAAMPTLIMRAVPMTETASANGLNTLLRAIGTSSSSAAMAAVTTVGVIRVGGDVFPSFGALVTVFWVSAGTSALAALVTIPLFRTRELSAHVGDRPAQDFVSSGRVVSSAGTPVRNAVVTVLSESGDEVDWSQADSAGDFAVATPGPGRYLFVTTADGWTPRSTILTVAGASLDPLVLPEQLSLVGQVSSAGGAVGGAVVALTRHTGEAVARTRTAHDGRYRMPLPTSGRYVLTACSPATPASACVPLAVLGMAQVVDLELR